MKKTVIAACLCGTALTLPAHAVEPAEVVDTYANIATAAYGDRLLTAGLARHGNQHLVAVLGDVDAYQNTGIRSMLNLGHSRSPRWCGLQSHHSDPSPGYGRLRSPQIAQRAAITFNGASFPTYYGPEYISGKLLEWAEKQGISLQHIQPGQPQRGFPIAGRVRGAAPFAPLEVSELP